MKRLNISCSQIREELLGFDWTAEDRARATRVLQHLELCEECRGATVEFEALRETVGPADVQAEPRRGWVDFGQRLAALEPAKGRSRWRLFMATAASLLIVLGGANLFLALHKQAQGKDPVVSASGAGLTRAEQVQDVQAFRDVASVFDHRASWILVSDSAAEMGLADKPVAATNQLMLVYLTVSRGQNTVSRATLAMVPGQAAQVAVPSTDGQRLAYTIQSSAADPRRISLYLEIGAPGKPGLASATLATNLQPEFGRLVKAGQLATRQGLYELTVGIYAEQAAAPPAGGTRL